MDYNNLWLYIVFVFLWMASPGPCFALVARNSVKYGVKSGIWTALGMVVCDALFVFLAVVGVAEILSHYPRLLEAGKMIGAAYIFYIGIQILWSTFKQYTTEEALLHVSETHKHMSPAKLFRMGFLTDAANPLLIVGMLALVLGFIDLSAGFSTVSIYAIIIPITTIYVDFAIAALFGNSLTRKFIMPYIKWFERVAGILIAGMAILMIIE